jgi:K+-sensing histidine kinase KdpD
MRTPNAHTHSSDDLAPDIEAMYQSFVANNDLRDTTQQILDLATHLTGAQNSSLMLLNGHGELYVLNSRGLDGAIRNVSRPRVGEGVAGQVALQGDPLLVEDIASDERFSKNKRNRYRTGSFIACPITSREKIIGVLNLNDKNTGEPFNPEDLDQAKMISLMAAAALASFLSDDRLKLSKADVDAIYHQLVEAECNKREFVARIAHDIRTPLNNIKGSVYYLKGSSHQDGARDNEFYEIIEKEVNYLISYLDESLNDYENIQMRLADIEEKERYKKLLE